MKLKSFGCSFVYGSDLADDGRGLVDQLPNGTWRSRVSQHTWPALLARHLDYTYDSYALPGIGNLQIADQVLTQLSKGQTELYVIGWTWIDRFDYVDSETNKWKTILPVNKNPITHTYYQYIHSQFRDKLTTLMNIKLVIDTLKQKTCPFIMTYMDELMFETEWHISETITYLQDYIRPHMTRFEGLSFLEWSRKHGYPESSNWHPLEEAHQAASDYILELGIHKV